MSLVQGKMATFEPSQRQSGAGVVPWSPPQVNWNPWTSSNIDEGPLAFVSLSPKTGEAVKLGLFYLFIDIYCQILNVPLMNHYRRFTCT